MLRVALYGTNGHQIQNALVSQPDARIAAICEFPREQLPPSLRDDTAIREYPTLGTLLEDPNIDLVSLCSPRRADQAADAIRALRAGKHVLAEKPCALTEADLDAIIRTARETGRAFHEMAGTAFAQPYLAMREIARSGHLGEIVQIIAEKSYPYFDARPQDEAVDGGIIMQNAIHALRFVEHVACVRIATIRAEETTLGNPRPDGGLRMAAAFLLTLKNGGLASIAANYLNPRGTKIWGDESLKIIGTLGIVESRAGGQTTRLVIGDNDLGPVDATPPACGFLQTLLASFKGRASMPFSIEDELSPTRWVIRAKQSATQNLNPPTPPFP